MTEAMVNNTNLWKDYHMKKIITLALLLAPITVEAAKPRSIAGPIHCGPKICNETIRPW